MLSAFAGEKYDLVLLMGVMQYLSDAERAEVLERVKSYLKPGGTLIATFQNGLFDLFTFNKYTVDAVTNMLLAEQLSEDEARQVQSAVGGLLAQPQAPAHSEWRARDNIFVRLEIRLPWANTCRRRASRLSTAGSTNGSGPAAAERPARRDRRTDQGGVRGGQRRRLARPFPRQRIPRHRQGRRLASMRAWTFPEGAQPIGVVVHDAGAANLIAAALRAGPRAHRVTAEGPAAAIWRTVPEAQPAASLEDALDGVGLVLTGTGWSSDLEHAARREAARRGIASVAVIDHWANYRARFVRGGETVLPDAVWVMDAAAEAEARRALPEVAVLRQPNLYLAEQAAAAGPVPPGGDLLFLAEPARSDWGAGRAGEFQALDYLATHCAAAGVPAGTVLRLRPHPSDPPGKYDAWISAHPGAGLDTAADVAGALLPARFVAGMNSAALEIALAAGRTTIVALPPNAPPCVLPIAGLVHLRDLA